MPYLCEKCYKPITVLYNQSYSRKQKRTEEPLDESERVGLKLNIQKTKIMASSLITSWQIDGETVETETLFGGAPKSL